MKKDRLIAAVCAAQKGHEFAYNVLIQHLKGAVFNIHRRKVSSLIAADEFYADGLEVLLNCVQKFDTRQPRAKFSTYFMTALSNHATDLVRAHYTKKADFEKNCLSDSNDEAGYHMEIGTDTYSPEDLYILREMLQNVTVATTPEFKKAVRHFLGCEVHHHTTHTRRLEQMQYRLKKAIQLAIK